MLFNDSVEGTGTIDKIMSSVIVFAPTCHLDLAWPTVPPPPQYEEKLRGICSVGMSHFVVHHLEYFLTNSSQRHNNMDSIVIQITKRGSSQVCSFHG